ncbi:MAG: hypothetical protein MUP16_12600 [Sedimentisphaerales bacterium]|nr:hypothetical protein [Sedimentisphaerales bacterium]
MLSRFLFIVCGLLLLTACQQQPTTDPLAYGPDVKTLVVTDDFIAKAIAATGGYEAWINAKKLELDCVVTFYEPPRLLVEDKSGGSFYLTQQHHEVYPWSNSVRISATEPQGKFVSLLSQDNFTSAQGQARYDIRNTIYAVRAITTAPVRLLDKSVEFSKPSEPVKIQGLWYYPIRCSRVTPAPSGVEGSDERRETVFYQSRDTSLVDIISFVGEKESLMVRGYDYRQVKETGVLLPTRIEVFAASSAGVIQHRLLKIDYYN